MRMDNKITKISVDEDSVVKSQMFVTEEKLLAEQVKSAKLEARIRALEDSGVKSVELRLEVHDKYIAERDKLLSLLRKYQWAGRSIDGTSVYCVCCKACRPINHSDNCEWGNALKGK